MLHAGKLGTLLRHMGHDAGEDELHEMLVSVGVESTGTFNRNEFLAMMEVKVWRHCGV